MKRDRTILIMVILAIILGGLAGMLAGRAGRDDGPKQVSTGIENEKILNRLEAIDKKIASLETGLEDYELLAMRLSLLESGMLEKKSEPEKKPAAPAVKKPEPVKRKLPKAVSRKVIRSSRLKPKPGDKDPYRDLDDYLDRKRTGNRNRVENMIRLFDGKGLPLSNQQIMNIENTFDRSLDMINDWALNKIQSGAETFRWNEIQRKISSYERREIYRILSREQNRANHGGNVHYP
ncbi:MAG: hypothetical protein ACYS8W_11550 [Planctomycetota bacterium]|jgi:hypothetical protein